tara:strand:- start:1516 stop:1689 length:174 start_codon:yes stop_codon:yes gene_type:complete
MNIEQQEQHVNTLSSDWQTIGNLVGFDNPEALRMEAVWSDAEKALDARIREETNERA